MAHLRALFSSLSFLHLETVVRTSWSSFTVAAAVRQQSPETRAGKASYIQFLGPNVLHDDASHSDQLHVMWKQTSSALQAFKVLSWCLRGELQEESHGKPVLRPSP